MIPLLTTASAAMMPQQQPLKLPDVSQINLPDWTEPLHDLQNSLKGFTEDVRAVWDSVAMAFPGAFDKANFFSIPKPHERKPDHEWDHIMKGSDIESLWVTNAAGDKERALHGKLAPYTLRSKAVDPSKLGVDPGVKQYSGYLDDDENDKHLFYWFFESRNDPMHDPVLLWLNGGPGCSSLTGLLMELGPSSVTEDIELKYNPFSWNNNASVIFLDQPVNTGFSYSGGSVSNTIAASKDVYALLTLFFEQFPEYAKQDFHIAGESYAGHYIPVFAHEILGHKKRNINLKSVLIGNGLTDGLTQYKYYEPMACGKGGWPAVLEDSECQAMANAYPRCAQLIQGCYDTESVWRCVPASVYCNNVLIGPYQRTGRNVYDIRGECKDSDNLCYPELGWISEYLNRDEVQKELGVETRSYSSCNLDVNRNFLFQGDWMRPFHRLIPSLLDEIPILVYAGDADYICNWLGNRAWTEALEWKGQKKYNKADTRDLELSGYGTKIGSVKASGNFTFIRLHAGGHMLPYDQPAASLDMLNRWLGGEWFEK